MQSWNTAASRRLTLRHILLQGVFHVELKYTSRGPRLIEVNCRMGGGPVRITNLLVSWRVHARHTLVTAAADTYMHGRRVQVLRAAASGCSPLRQCNVQDGRFPVCQLVGKCTPLQG
jgi:biotin carboxylase